MLRKAAELIEEHGWHQGGFYGHRRACCLVGAVFWVYKGEPDAMYSYERCPALQHVTQLLGVDDPRGITTWNDGVCQSQKEAIEVLMTASRTAARAEGYNK